MAHLAVRYGVSVRRACEATGFPRSTHQYRARHASQEPLRMRLRELATSRVRYGYRRLHVLLRREGWAINVKRVYRLYGLERLRKRIGKPVKDVAELGHVILNDVKSFVGGHPQSDDMCLVCFGRV